MLDNDTPLTTADELVRADVAGILAARSQEECAVIERAIRLASQAHAGQQRESGEPYFRHSLAVAVILSGLNLDHETLAAAFLHDVVEDTDISLDRIRTDFGPVIARLVDGVTRMERIGDFQQSATDRVTKSQHQAESLRKLLLAMAEDVRVVLIKLADRLHNMRTLQHLDPERRQRIARETLDIYAPLANRLGVWQFKWELEDLALRYLEPEVYRSLAAQLAEKREDRESYIATVIAILQEELGKAGVTATVSGRPKHIYSIWRKMQRKQLDFDQIFDTRAVRILVDRDRDCYAALGIVHGLWRHIPKEFDDYIANPKENLYRSLHTAVVGPQGRTLEVQIRTHEMHRHAELGVAAHWRYKEGGGVDAGYEEKVAWLRQLLEWRDEERSAYDFVDRFKSEAFQERVYVLTPQGRIIDLPQGATPLDFAYAVHTEIGHRCRGARVDGRIVPLNSQLANGQQVEILTARNASPSRDWLNTHQGYLATSRARARVRSWFKHQDFEHNISAGRDILDRELHRLGVSGLPVDRLAERLRQNSVDELLSGLGSGDVTTGQLAGAISDLVPQEQVLRPRPARQPRKRAQGGGGDFTVQGIGNLLATPARCCNPVPQDPIIGYITRGRGVTIHRQDCGNILRLRGDDRARLITVEWGDTAEGGYLVDISVEAYDRSGLLRDITALLAHEKINLSGTQSATDERDRIAHMDLTLEITDIGQLSRVLNRISQLPNVISARRKT